MSKLLASEFQTWDSLYWPDNIPRTTELSKYTSSPSIFTPNSEWQLIFKEHSINWVKFTELVGLVVKSLRLAENFKSFAVLDSSPVAIVVGSAASFITGMSMEIIIDTGEDTVEDVVDDDFTQDFFVKHFKIGSSSVPSQWEPSEPSISLVHQEGRIIYPLDVLWGAIDSFNTFTSLKMERGVAVVGALHREFEFFAAISALVSGVPLALLGDFLDLDTLQTKQYSALIVGHNVVQKAQESGIERSIRVLGRYRNSLSYIGVEGVLSSGFTKRLEKSCGIPILQMFGIPGRGIILSNPREFNVHGSVGIPVTNIETVIADSYEGNWMRDRILMGPGTEGELAVRGAFIDAMKSVGDSRQNAVKLTLLDQSTEWVATGIMGKMDENGYFYLDDVPIK